MLAGQQAVNQAGFIGHLKQGHPDVRPYAGKLPRGGREILTGVTLRVQDLEASCDVLMPVTRAASMRA